MAELLAIIGVFGIPLSAIWTHHRRKVLEMQLQLRNQGDGSVRTDLEAMRHELRSLRDTSTQYDLSFDAALQRMEHRVQQVERRVSAIQPEEVLRAGNGR